MHRQLSLSASPRQQQQDDGGSGSVFGFGGDAAQAMAVGEDESASHSKADRARSAMREERAIHLIPLLTFLCFLLLFLFSHDPSSSGTFPAPPSLHSRVICSSGVFIA
jgi:hypothetical protein